MGVWYMRSMLVAIVCRTFQALAIEAAECRFPSRQLAYG
jgi:hypothetical protein